MKAKREFYMYGNDRQFAEEHLISTMTGEPMPKKWQRFIELTPAEKARWDDSLRLDAEYRVAEAQGFPNGIPGGRMRGSALYTITQMEEEHECELQKKRMEEAREQYEQSFIPYKTEIQNDVGVVYGNISPVNQLWQNPYDTQKNDLTTGISAFSAPQTEKEPAFDVNQAIRKLASQLESRFDDSEERAKVSSSLMQSGQDDNVMNETVLNGMGSSLMQTFNQKYSNQIRPDLTKEDMLKRWAKKLENGDYVILGDNYDDGIVLPRKEFMDRQAMDIYGKNRFKQRNPVWDSDYDRRSVEAMPNNMGEKEYIYPIQRLCTDMKKAPYANVQKMLYVNKGNERYNTNAFEKDGTEDVVYNWDYGDASDYDERRYQQYADDSLVTDWPSENQNFNNGYLENSDSRYMFTTNGADAYMQFYGTELVEDISAIMKEWGSDYDKWVAGLRQEDKAAFNLLTGIVLDTAEIFVARIPFFPVRIAGIAILMSITIYLAAKEVEEEWNQKVEETMRKEKCSKEVAEEQLKPILLRLIANKIMEKVREEWVKKYLDDDGMPALARVVITQDWKDALEAIAGENSTKPVYDL